MSIASEMPSKANVFMARHAEATALLAAITARLVDDHMGVDPDAVTWGDCGDMGHVLEQLRELAEIVGAEVAP